MSSRFGGLCCHKVIFFQKLRDLLVIKIFNVHTSCLNMLICNVYKVLLLNVYCHFCQKIPHHFLTQSDTIGAFYFYYRIYSIRKHTHRQQKTIVDIQLPTVNEKHPKCEPCGV